MLQLEKGVTTKAVCVMATACFSMQCNSHRPRIQERLWADWAEPDVARRLTYCLGCDAAIASHKRGWSPFSLEGETIVTLNSQSDDTRSEKILKSAKALPTMAVTVGQVGSTSRRVKERVIDMMVSEKMWQTHMK